MGAAENATRFAAIFHWGQAKGPFAGAAQLGHAKTSPVCFVLFCRLVLLRRVLVFLLLPLFHPLLLLIVSLLELLQLLVLPLLELLLSLFDLLLLSLIGLLLLSLSGLLLLPPHVVLVELLLLLSLLLFDLLALLGPHGAQILKFPLVLALALRVVGSRAGIAGLRRRRTVVRPAGIAGGL